MGFATGNEYWSGASRSGGKYGFRSCGGGCNMSANIPFTCSKAEYCMRVQGVLALHDTFDNEGGCYLNVNDQRVMNIQQGHIYRHGKWNGHDTYSQAFDKIVPFRSVDKITFYVHSCANEGAGNE